MRADGKERHVWGGGSASFMFSVLCAPQKERRAFASPATEPCGRFRTKDLRWGHGPREAVTAISGLQGRTQVPEAHSAAGEGAGLQAGLWCPSGSFLFLSVPGLDAGFRPSPVTSDRPAIQLGRLQAFFLLFFFKFCGGSEPARVHKRGLFSSRGEWGAAAGASREVRSASAFGGARGGTQRVPARPGAQVLSAWACASTSPAPALSPGGGAQPRTPGALGCVSPSHHVWGSPLLLRAGGTVLLL